MKKLSKLLLFSTILISVSAYSQRPNLTDSGASDWDYCPCVSGIQALDFNCPCEIVLSNNDRRIIRSNIIAKPKAESANTIKERRKALAYLKEINFKNGGKEKSFLFSEDWWDKLFSE